jgi:hypothetical protein
MRLEMLWLRKHLYRQHGKVKIIEKTIWKIFKGLVVQEGEKK